MRHVVLRIDGKMYPLSLGPKRVVPWVQRHAYTDGWRVIRLSWLEYFAEVYWRIR